MTGDRALPIKSKHRLIRATPEPRGVDPILALRGQGKGLWVNESPDDYVRRLREE